MRQLPSKWIKTYHQPIRSKAEYFDPLIQRHGYFTIYTLQHCKVHETYTVLSGEHIVYEMWRLRTVTNHLCNTKSFFLQTIFFSLSFIRLITVWYLHIFTILILFVYFCLQSNCNGIYSFVTEFTNLTLPLGSLITLFMALLKITNSQTQIQVGLKCSHERMDRVVWLW